MFEPSHCSSLVSNDLFKFCGFHGFWFRDFPGFPCEAGDVKCGPGASPLEAAKAVAQKFFAR